jgi:predicted small secreted protein
LINSPVSRTDKDVTEYNICFSICMKKIIQKFAQMRNVSGGPVKLKKRKHPEEKTKPVLYHSKMVNGHQHNISKCSQMALQCI